MNELAAALLLVYMSIGVGVFLLFLLLMHDAHLPLLQRVSVLALIAVVWPLAIPALVYGAALKASRQDNEAKLNPHKKRGNWWDTDGD